MEYNKIIKTEVIQIPQLSCGNNLNIDIIKRKLKI